jgi:hypothetical protein
LIKKSAQGAGDISERGAAIIVACTSAECEAIHRQCMCGPLSASNIFVDEVVSPESIPAGLMIRALVEIVTQTCCHLNHDQSVRSLQNCIQALATLKEPVLVTISLKCPDPQCNTEAFVDPRPTLAEAWFQAMSALAEIVTTQQTSERIVMPSAVENLLVDTCSIMVSLLFYPSLGKTISERASDPGMSLDGPHSLAMMSFFGAYFRLQIGMLQKAGERLLGLVPTNLQAAQIFCTDRTFQGTAIIGASLFRACQGALPPWAIEAIPEVYSALFEFALGNDVDVFGLWIRLSMELRLQSSPQTTPSLGSLSDGQLLSGRCFEGMSNQAKMNFVNEAKLLARAGGGADWRRLKGLIKQACGGKKKDTDFNQKPSPTRWDFERV